jgi:FMN phosphatase YigB (HAD superfamily)
MREALAFESAFPEDVDLDALAWAFARDATGEPPPEADSYLRFAVRARGLPESAYRGIFHTAYALLKKDDGSPDQKRLRELLIWFEANLHPHDPRMKRAIFWFRRDAVDCIERVWELVHIVQRAGFKVVLLSEHAPGRIVYRDAHQIAALPLRR